MAWTARQGRPHGDAGAFVAERHTAPGGKLPLNTNGRGRSYMHCGMYGMYALQESVRQICSTASAQILGAKISVCHGAASIENSASFSFRTGVASNDVLKKRTSRSTEERLQVLDSEPITQMPPAPDRSRRFVRHDDRAAGGKHASDGPPVLPRHSPRRAAARIAAGEVITADISRLSIL